MSSPVATFRDPAGSLRIDDERVLRTVHPEYAEDCLSFLGSELAQSWIASGRLVETRVLSSNPGEELELEHQRVFFPSYPWEWTPGQWIAAAELTLDFAEQQLSIGRVLKDATPLNVLFEGSRPVFVDVLSTEARELENPLWMAYGQFVRTFLLPLAAYKYLGWPLAASLSRRDGYEPRDIYPYLSAWTRLQPAVFSKVTLPFLVEKKNANNTSSAKLKQRPDVALYMHRRRIKRLRRALRAFTPKMGDSRWSGYPESASHYSPDDHAEKQEFIERILYTAKPAHVLDIGANTGEYSRLAAQAGASVVAWDTDVAAAEQNWSAACESRLSILPLIADAARPTPALGWQNAETSSLLDRARGRFDLVMMLGLIHHLLLIDQIPMAEVARLVNELTNRWAVVEWVPATDVRFKELCRGRDSLYFHLDQRAFLRSFTQYFEPVARKPLSNGRVLFFLLRNH
ncbi:MAG TPA: class I SAM-dependent methyltransferase [Terriglobales bacterium]|nr:class I SAM-dependent methyltransferase [Terriglobales bacterium]